jgi:CheY-like chemotaxis protein
MLRDLASRASPANGVASSGAALAGVPVHAEAEAFARAPCLLIVHHGDPRLVALEVVLNDLGYATTVVASADEAVAAIARGPLPDVLLTAHTPGGARRGVAFARECLARWPTLRTLYITFVPRGLPDLPDGREVVLAAPFNAEQLAAALAELRTPEPALR